MTFNNFHRRLRALHKKRQKLKSAEENEALNNIIDYLNSLALRKAVGDQRVQSEIIAVNNFLRSQIN